MYVFSPDKYNTENFDKPLISKSHLYTPFMSLYKIKGFIEVLWKFKKKYADEKLYEHRFNN